MTCQRHTATKQLLFPVLSYIPHFILLSYFPGALVDSLGNGGVPKIFLGTKGRMDE